MSWNLNGKLRTNLRDENFLSLICAYDILFFSETHLKDNDVDIVGYESIIINRPAALTNPHDKGGIAFFIKKHLTKGISQQTINDNGIAWIKLDKHFFSLDEDYYLCGTYIPHERSTFYRRFDIDFFDSLENDIASYSSVGKVFIFGDFNSRTSICKDFIEDNNISEFTNNDLFLEDIRYYSDRSNKDKIVNSYGRRLLQLCISCNLLIGNGRLNADQSDSYTCCTHQGMSTVDYLLLCHTCFGSVLNFSVGHFTEFSDHAPLSFSLESYTNICNNDLFISNKPKNIMSWDKDKVDVYRQALSNVLHNITSDITCDNYENVLDELSTKIYDVSFKLFGKTIHTRQQSTLSNDWFNDECRLRKREFNDARNKFSHNKTNNDFRKQFLQARTAYNKAKRKARSANNRKQARELCNLAKSDPREFWKRVKNTKKAY